MNVLYANVALFFVQYWPSVLVVCVALIILANIRRKAVQNVLGLMLRAEKNAEANGIIDGPEIFAWVVAGAYQLLPAWLRVMWPQAKFAVFCQKAYDEAKVLGSKIFIDQDYTVIQPTVTEPQTQEVSPPVVAAPGYNYQLPTSGGTAGAPNAGATITTNETTQQV